MTVFFSVVFQFYKLYSHVLFSALFKIYEPIKTAIFVNLAERTRFDLALDKVFPGSCAVLTESK